MPKSKSVEKEIDLNKRKAQLHIPLEKIDLDEENPRLGDQYLKASQLNLLSVLYQDFDIEEIALSMALKMDILTKSQS